MNERELGGGGEGGAERERERRGGGGGENSNSKTLFYKDCRLGSVKTQQLVLAKLLKNKNKITWHHLRTYK